MQLLEATHSPSVAMVMSSLDDGRISEHVESQIAKDVGVTTDTM